MTVKELIKYLKTLDQSKRIMAEDDMALYDIEKAELVWYDSGSKFYKETESEFHDEQVYMCGR